MRKFSKEKLEKIAQNSLYTTFTNARTITYSFEIFKRYLKKGRLLELGPAEGLMTEHLLTVNPDITIVEGSKIFCKNLRRKFPKLKINNALFEEVDFDDKFDTIVLGHVLEHVQDPIKILKRIIRWMNKDSVVLCAVPNARSIHRQAAVMMGLIESVFVMSDKDKHHGHMRIYTPETLIRDFNNSGFEIINRGGYWLKPISDRQIEDSWSKEMLDTFMKLGEFYPDISAEIYVVAKIRQFTND